MFRQPEGGHYAKVKARSRPRITPGRCRPVQARARPVIKDALSDTKDTHVPAESHEAEPFNSCASDGSPRVPGLREKAQTSEKFD